MTAGTVGPTSEELAESKELKAKVRRPEEDNEILREASIFFAVELDPRNRGVLWPDARRWPRAQDVGRVLREQGCQIVPRTYRTWTQHDPVVADRTISDAHVEDVVRGRAFTVSDDGRRRLIPQGLYGRRKMTALVRRSLPDASRGAVDRAMRLLAYWPWRAPRAYASRSRGKEGRRVGDMLNRHFTADAPSRA